MAAHGSGSTTTCTFTSSYSTWDRKRFADCCATSKPFSFVFCDNCDPALDLARCSLCYGKFSSKLKRRLPEISSSMGAEPHLEPVMKALFHTDWAAVGRGDRRAGNDLIYFEEESGKWRWRKACPCCYDFEVPEVDAVMPVGYAEITPRVLGIYELFILAPVLDASTGLRAQPVWQQVKIVELGEVLTKEQEELFKFRACDPPEHLGYLVEWQPPPRSCGFTGPRWTLTVGVCDSGEEPYALSLISWDRLNGQRDDGLAFLECIRQAAGFHQSVAQGGWNPSPSNISLGEGSIADSAIRVNRVSGPFGHLDVGSRFRDWAHCGET
jgi:hypothetical protein